MTTITLGEPDMVHQPYESSCYGVQEWQRTAAYIGGVYWSFLGGNLENCKAESWTRSMLFPQQLYSTSQTFAVSRFDVKVLQMTQVLRLSALPCLCEAATASLLATWLLDCPNKALSLAFPRPGSRDSTILRHITKLHFPWSDQVERFSDALWFLYGLEASSYLC